MDSIIDRKRSEANRHAAEALTRLHESTGLKGATTSSRSATARDGGIQLQHGRARWSYSYQSKRDIDRFSKLFLLRAHGPQEDFLLICNPISNELAQYCREHGIQFIDTAGNCYLHRDGLFAFVSGQKGDSAHYAADASLTPAALRLMFAALTAPAILNKNYRAIAPQALIATGSVGPALQALGSLGLVTETPHGTRVIMSAEKMLHTWALGYAGLLRPKLKRQRFSSDASLEQVRRRFSPAENEVLIGGEVAAAEMTNGLKPSTLTLYVDPENTDILPDLVRKLRLKKDLDGSIEIAPIFWNTEALPSFPFVPEALVYADLIATDDSRNIEVAQSIAKRIIGHVDGTR